MAARGRTVTAVVAGVVLWSIVWVAGGQLAAAVSPANFGPGQPVTSVGALIGFLAFAAVLSVLTGYATAALAGTAPATAVRIVAGVLLVMGIGFEASAWSLTPVWYHIAFLLLLVPAILYGGSLRAGQAAAVRGARA